MKDNDDTPENQESEAPLPKKAVMYVRMPADHPHYSIEHQAMAIRCYAKQRRIKIIASYTEGGTA